MNELCFGCKHKKPIPNSTYNCCSHPKLEEFYPGLNSDFYAFLGDIHGRPAIAIMSTDRIYQAALWYNDVCNLHEPIHKETWLSRFFDWEWAGTAIFIPGWIAGALAIRLGYGWIGYPIWGITLSLYLARLWTMVNRMYNTTFLKSLKNLRKGK